MNERNKEIVRLYRETLIPVAEIGRRFGLSQAGASHIVAKAGAIDGRRRAKATRKRWLAGEFADVEFRQGRKSAWPECPPEKRDAYHTLTRKAKIPAREARAMLEGAA